MPVPAIEAYASRPAARAAAATPGGPPEPTDVAAAATPGGAPGPTVVVAAATPGGAPGPTVVAAAAPAHATCSSRFPTTRLETGDIVRTITKRPRYTQGLLVHEGRLYESAGMYGHSGIYLSDLAGEGSRRLAGIGADYFGEGFAIVGHQAFFLTWQAQKAFRYAVRSNGTLATPADGTTTLAYEGQGWGLTTYGDHLLMSDGSAELRVVDPRDFSTTRRVPVKAGARMLRGLNELETVGDRLLANVYGSSAIAVVDLETGCLVEALDATPLVRLVQADLPGADEAVCNRGGCNRADFVLNGIAYDPSADELYLTGKNWPVIYVLTNPLAGR